MSTKMTALGYILFILGSAAIYANQIMNNIPVTGLNILFVLVMMFGCTIGGLLMGMGAN